MQRRRLVPGLPDQPALERPAHARRRVPQPVHARRCGSTSRSTRPAGRPTAAAPTAAACSPSTRPPARSPATSSTGCWPSSAAASGPARCGSTPRRRTRPACSRWRSSTRTASHALVLYNEGGSAQPVTVRWAGKVARVRVPPEPSPPCAGEGGGVRGADPGATATNARRRDEAKSDAPRPRRAAAMSGGWRRWAPAGLVSPAQSRRDAAAGSNTRVRNCRVRSCAGAPMICAGGPSSTITPPSMKTTRSATSRAKLISWVTTIIVMPSSARSRMTASTSPTSSGSSAEVGSSKSITLGLHRSARAMATRCCWPPDSCAG